MALIEWDDSISVHIPHIDEQHKKLIGWINSLNDSISAGEGEKEVASVLQNLILYVFEHFSEEERLMLSVHFPDLAKHRSEHDYFVNKMKSVQADFNDGKAISDEIVNFLIEWLICHIKGTDQKYSHYILKKEALIQN